MTKKTKTDIQLSPAKNPDIDGRGDFVTNDICTFSWWTDRNRYADVWRLGNAGPGCELLAKELQPNSTSSDYPDSIFYPDDANNTIETDPEADEED